MNPSRLIKLALEVLTCPYCDGGTWKLQDEALLCSCGAIVKWTGKKLKHAPSGKMGLVLEAVPSLGVKYEFLLSSKLWMLFIQSEDYTRRWLVKFRGERGNVTPAYLINGFPLRLGNIKQLSI